MRLGLRMTLSIVALFTALLLIAPLVFADHNININTTSLEELDALPGVGPTIAQRIIEGRPYSSVEEVSRVDGIGEPGSKSYEDIVAHIVVTGGSSSGTQPPAQSSAQTSTPTSAAPPSVSSASELVVDGGSDRTLIAGAGVQFSARAYRNKDVLENTSFMWNFGDGSTAQGASVVHRFEYPGRYAVIVTGSKDGANGSDRFTVTAESAQLAVRALPDGSVEIENLSTRDVDLSHWVVQFSGRRFALPENTSVLAKQTMRISPNTLHFYAGSTSELDYPDGTLAFRAGEYAPDTAPATADVTRESAPSPVPAPARAEEQGASGTASKQESAVDEEETVQRAAEVQEREPFATSSNVAAAAISATGAWKWWFGAIAISALAGGAVFVSRRVGRKEWNIVDDTSE